MADFNQYYSNSHCSIHLFVLYFDRLLLRLCYAKKVDNNPELFCYICGSFTTKGKQRSITSDIKRSKSCTLVAHYETKTKNEHHIRYVQLILLVYTIGYANKRHRCLLLFPLYGENQKTTFKTAICALSM